MVGAKGIGKTSTLISFTRATHLLYENIIVVCVNFDHVKEGTQLKGKLSAIFSSSSSRRTASSRWTVPG